MNAASTGSGRWSTALFPLEDGPRALAELASGDQFGKLVLTP
ncbi:hypothetical protein [Amycolatopsis sp. ATCC 39116]|nr:hypothetical protein [Amycolatopsis sp. ATCC 39116]